MGAMSAQKTHQWLKKDTRELLEGTQEKSISSKIGH